MTHPNPKARKQMNSSSMAPKVQTGGPESASAPQTGRASGKHHRAMGGGPPAPRQRKRSKGFQMPKPDKYGYY